MPFNKGDFTQQGVAGHVNANIRLNEKRLVNIDLTSNEEAEGCTITGAVTDLLNNEVYPIGAGVSGNIEITENGENIDVAPYATATVNVSGGGGIPLCTATIINETVNDVQLSSVISGFTLENNILYIGDDITIHANETKILNLLYQYDSYADTILIGSLGSALASNMVNCSPTIIDGYTALVATDNTLASSVTINVQSGGI